MKKIISLLAAFVLVLAGCGSSSDDNTLGVRGILIDMINLHSHIKVM